MRLLLGTLFVVSCLSLLCWTPPVITEAEGADARAGASVAVMPKQCRAGKTSPEALGWRWKHGTQVKVYYLKGNFSAAEAGALSRAVANWNEVLRETDSRVAFVVVGERDAVVRDGAGVYVARGVPSSRERVGEIKLHSASGGAVRFLLTISPAITDESALTSLMTHELGHSLGLADCYECQSGTTAMAAFRSMKKGNEVYEPSACDKYVVAAGYSGRTVDQTRVASLGQK
ncbi:MAG TPA: hypothetical protein VJT82_01320 [Pyrinomonadaceae bacterium]|nr:hypothetical protein [Pyrinomonadaceae bacterium]